MINHPYRGSHYGPHAAAHFLVAVVGEDYVEYDIPKAVSWLFERGRTYDIQDCDTATLNEALAYAHR
jgi:hypothetical protein